MFSVLVPPNQEPHKRRGHKKSRGGCHTCKERKMKCDETKPICNNCSRRFPNLESCEYSKSSNPTSTKTSPAALAPKPLTRPRNGDFTHFSQNGSRQVSPSRNIKEKDFDVGLCLPVSLRGGLLDPFRTYPSTNVGHADSLIRFYLQETVYTHFPWQPPSPTNPTTTFFTPLIFSDTVLFHAILHLTSIRYCQRQKLQENVEMAMIAGESIRLLRDRVENEMGDNGISDLTIGAVAVLAGTEHEKGNLKMLRLHLSGLQQMLRLRGGLNSIRQTSPMISNSLFWIFLVSIYEVPFPPLDTILPPFFPQSHGLSCPSLYSSSSDTGNGLTHPGQSTSNCFTHFHDDHQGLEEEWEGRFDVSCIGLVEPIRSVLHSIHHAANLVPINEHSPTAETSQAVLTRLCTLLSHLLSLPPFTIQPGEEAIWERKYEVLISECMRYAIIVHILTPWRGLPPDGTLALNHLLNLLILSLRNLFRFQNAFEGREGERNDILLLWVLTVGGVAAEGKEERKWFRAHMLEVGEELGIRNWECLRGCLKRVLWNDVLCEKSHAKLWGEVLEVGREEDGLVWLGGE